MAMTEQHKAKIREGVKKYHACAKSHGCGKGSVEPVKKPVKKKQVKKEQVKKVPILQLENIKQQTKPAKIKKQFKTNQAKRKEANAVTKKLYKKSVHQILGLKPTASPDEIKKAYRTFALKFHPDKQGGNKEKFSMYATAYRGMINSIDIM